MLSKDYLKEQLTILWLILDGDFGDQYSEEYINEKFENILSGRGISAHDIIKQAMKAGKLQLVEK